MNESIQVVIRKLLAYCRANEWAGYDPYDALNSRLFASAPMLDRRIPRLVLTQILKRLPVNFRPLLAIPKTQNPKGLALFLSAFVKLRRTEVEDQEKLIAFMIERLEALRSPGVAYSCWGYSFPWQTRTVVVPSGAPNLVCTTFVANALLDSYEHTGNAELFEMAASSALYILNELYWVDGAVAGFAYPLPSIRNNVHNSNFLAAALLCRVGKHTGDAKLIEAALKVARYSASQQHPDGSWSYGETPTQKWIDNFHTGFNLCALREIAKSLETDEFEPYVKRGFAFYLEHFFREDGAAKYYHNATYPVDIHCVAQSIITLLALKDLDSRSVSLAQKVFQWAMEHMWDEKGFFYHRVLRGWTNRISYMRWSQAWMFLALTLLVYDRKIASNGGAMDDAAPLEEIGKGRMV